MNKKKSILAFVHRRTGRCSCLIVLLCVGILTSGISSSPLDNLWNKAQRQNLMSDSTRIYLEELIHQARKVDDILFEAEAHYLLGKHYFLIMKDLRAREHFHQARHLFERLHHWEKTGFTHVQLGLVGIQENDLDSAIAHFQQAITVFTSKDLTQHLRTPYMGISSVYQKAGNVAAAFRYARQAIASIPEGADRTGKVIALRHILQLSREHDSLRVYAVYADDMLKLYSPLEIDDQIIQHIDHFVTIEDPHARIKAIESAIHRLEEWPTTLEMISSYYQLGHSYIATGDIPGALHAWQTAYSLEKDSLRTIHFSPALLRAISQAYESMNDPAEALNYFKMYESIKADLMEENIKTRTEELQLQFESLAKDQQIAGQQLMLRRLTNQRNLIVGLSLILLIAAAYVFHIQRRHLADQSTITHQQESLHKNELSQLRKQHQLESLQTLITAQEEERKRIAQDLHDSLGGLLATLKIKTRNTIASGDTSTSVPDTPDQLALIDTVSAEVRRIAHNMMPRALIRMGLSAALEDLVNALHQDRDLAISFQNIDYDNALDQEKEIMLYRIAQELCANVLRHASARHLLIQLSRHNGSASLVVEDDGHGFDPDQEKKGMGLDSIRSRVAYIHGEMEILTAPGEGTSVTINVPVI